VGCLNPTTTHSYSPGDAKIQNREISAKIQNREISAKIQNREISAKIKNREISAKIKNREISAKIKNMPDNPQVQSIPPLPYSGPHHCEVTSAVSSQSGFVLKMSAQNHKQCRKISSA